MVVLDSFINSGRNDIVRRGNQSVRLILALSICLGSVGCYAGAIVTLLPQRLETNKPSSPIVYWHETRTSPRPLQIHVLRVDLRSRLCANVALIADDPDGDGPAESQLEKPLALASGKGVVAAVNANAFDLVPPPPKGAKRDWIEHSPVDILGWAREGNHEVSPPQHGTPSFWIDAKGRGYVGDAGSAVEPRVAVAGFGSLVRDSRLVDAEVKPLHPRTAVGVSRDGCALWMVVVDGRQAGYSEGMATGELAALMKELGCWDAMNLDGGGSSILLLAEDGKPLSIMNRPSDAGTRPVPVLLGVRLRR